MPTKKILHIISTLDRAGAEKSLATLVTHLPRSEFEVHVCALTRGGPYEEQLRGAGVPVTVIGKRHKVDPPAYLKLKRHIRHLRPDLVQTWMFTANTYGRAAARAAGVRQIVASEQCADPWKSGLQRAIDRRLAKQTAAIVANAEGVRQFYVAHGVPADKIRVIHGGVAAHLPSKITKAELLAQLTLPADSQLIGAIGRLSPQKKLRDLVWASDLIKVARDGVHTLIIGDGPQRDALQKFRDQCAISD
ncbi:MAG: glycosyltransferase, partial [Pirellulales bacterium]